MIKPVYIPEDGKIRYCDLCSYGVFRLNRKQRPLIPSDDLVGGMCCICGCGGIYVGYITKEELDEINNEIIN